MASLCFEMNRCTNATVQLCSKIHHVPAAMMCVFLYILQASVLDYYLINFINILYICFLVADLFVLVALVVSIIYGHTKMDRQRSAELAQTRMMFSLSWVSWLLININASAKIIIIVKYNAWPEEKDPSFFGPNVFKTAIALSSCIFLFLLTTQHDAPLGSDRRTYISDLTGTVVFDILDTVDILEVFFTEEDRDLLWNGLEEVILTQATMNLILPTVPLITLSLTHFGLDKPKRPMMYLHRLLVVLVVNLPNLLTRMILWHGLSVGISPFTLKNIILIGIAMYEFYEHKKEKLEDSRLNSLEIGDRNFQQKDVKRGHLGSLTDTSTEPRSKVPEISIELEETAGKQVSEDNLEPKIYKCVPRVSLV
ncbi:uncharacterized protein LOC106063828 [Biomphalaria glabrata]|uniref:Uncharacterized protein LOC106063828 n=1 Tax=Biomphalaria glabrata TaxID=6526 RepID=A0A9W2ZS47_BIOGL|nr:uncharacterized protein LOC106063828 [Biomphalaria glabrata]XP_055877856.1 uncharacterized protein LOC106063828 [Biomphalaria glabrata]XP_055877857.1 uncharacterized protein LOC106063828 [Biomphalaria glabrata]XP_055877858.1 uncharacterized protein LOC106063828 [Biomphalaria glabrata]XP_055877859.1 uncharacterized protein LOC106063828 [Biomphalaria glabrata]